ncbi:3-oxoacyl-ACP reductase [Kurthia sibirica]|uniref:3-oxoacyl-ACP reductase n=1 Tax=Kurthia sibirica TaxID=202750 RepID=A0A2U3APJ9_9BACL|nr:3-oxoacyl-ACP reductase [Kurthia sibirica]PWI26461.1 3-oxoacyl-ACP reductase [Kurthia sibirica]GEK33029.1 NAD(P)-dependent dehydrogenase [Kurthia sibirica]
MIFEEFKNKVVFMTGAASGIGFAQAEAFLQNGASLFALDIQEGRMAELQVQYQERCQFIVGSVANSQHVAEAVKQAIRHYHQIDILLNTAGILDGFAKTLDTDETLWDRVINTNLKGVYLVTNAVLPHMILAGSGTIVNMASIAGLVAGGGGASYTASKHAIIGYTKQLDMDYCRQGIRANAIAPGAIDTPMNAADFEGDGKMAQWVAEQTPAGRWAKPHEIANVSLFLASCASDYMHGTVIPVDGGWIAK